MKKPTKNCSKCGRSISVNNLRRHEEACGTKRERFFSVDGWKLGEDLYECPICNKQYNKKGIITHYYRKHVDEGIAWMKSWAETGPGQSMCGKKAWNNGLTKEDHPSLLSASHKMKKYVGELNSFKGKKHSRESRKKIRLSTIEYIEAQHGKMSPRKGKYETKILDTLQRDSGLEIERDLNISGFYPDGVIRELNVIVEIDEPFHDREFQSYKDRLRQRELVDEGFQFFRIKEREWFRNKDFILRHFRCFVECRKELPHLA